MNHSKRSRTPGNPLQHRQEAAAEQSESRLTSLRWLIGAILFIAVIAIFSASLPNNFVNLDDPTYVTGNPVVQAGLRWKGVLWAFGYHGANWHPLTWISHMLDCQLFGQKPWGHHLTNALFHGANALLLFVLLDRTTRFRWRSLFVASLFAFHPIHVESVAWISERKDVLSTFFWLLTLLAYSVWAQGSRGAKKFYVLSLVFFVCGLMCKPMLVTTPFVLLLLDYWPLRRLRGVPARKDAPVLREKIPFLLLSAGSCLITFAAQRGGGAVMSLAGFPLDLRIENTFISYCRYVEKILWPRDLVVYYPYPYSWPATEVLPAVLVVVAISVVVILARKRQPAAFVGWFWYLGTLVPVVGILQVGTQSIADRYTYFPSIGVFILLTWSLADFGRRLPGFRWGLGGAAAAVVASCAFLTVRQIGYWRNSETLFRHAVEAGYDKSVAELHLGMALDDRGATKQALLHLRAAKRLNPLNPYTRFTLAELLDKEGQTEEAMKEIQDAIRLLPTYARAYFFQGLLLEKVDRPEQALLAYEKAAELDPDLPLVRYNLAVLLDHDGRVEEAIVQYRGELKVNPRWPAAYNNLGKDLLLQQHVDEAVKQFRKAIQILPDYAEAHNNLGAALYLQGKRDEAIPEFREALRLQPKYQDAKNNLHSALNDAGHGK
jgi:protein O-mannosyl-transferase